MKKSLLKYVGPLVVCIMGICMMVFFAACSGVATTTNGTQMQITGKLVSVDQASQSATFLYNGQQVTVNQLTSDQINTLKPLVGKTVTVQVTKTGDTTYNITVGTNAQVSDTSVTTTSTTTTTNNSQPTTTANVAPGTIDFIGKVQSINASSITVTLPNGEAIQMAINALTKRDNDFLPGQPTVGQLIKIDGYTNTDGSFTAKSFDVVKPDDQADTIKMNTVDFKGVTTSAVGTDNVLHFNVGNKSYNYAMNNTTRIKDFVNPQSIAANQPVKVEVLFNNGSNGTVTKVENGVD